ncbi:MAG: glycine zipper 2TM domain-containing protein [Gammaproteobacteria bacterium]|nr:glycine zipper 2TM domain-containing protein [Gammaproteobacteria bacterium]
MQFRRLIQPAALATATILAAGVQASSHYETAPVTSVIPVYEKVRYAVPVDDCRAETVRLPQYGAPGTAPIVGAILGGAVGNAVGHKKRNKQVGAVLGAVLGASIANDIARGSPDRSRVRHGTRRVCDTFTEYRDEDRLVGYDVTYEYAGRAYSTRMKRHPGDAIRIRVTPIERY